MKKEFVILSQDSQALFDAEKEKFTAKIFKAGTDFFKVTLFTDTDYFNVAVYDSFEFAQSEVERLYRELEHSKNNSFCFDVQNDLTPLQLLDSIDLELEGSFNEKFNEKCFVFDNRQDFSLLNFVECENDSND